MPTLVAGMHVFVAAPSYPHPCLCRARSGPSPGLQREGWGEGPSNPEVPLQRGNVLRPAVAACAAVSAVRRLGGIGRRSCACTITAVLLLRPRRQPSWRMSCIWSDPSSGTGRGVPVGDTRIRPQGIQYRGAQQELISRRRAGVAAGEVRDGGRRQIPNAGEIGCRQHI
jgi:hypothetical protein